MINKENSDSSPDTNNKKDTDGILDVAVMDVQCHLLIKDKDTSEILVNQRG